MNILLNPVLVSVVVMCVLCLLKINVLLAIMAAAILAGFMSGMNIDETMKALINDMGGQSETALSYVLLGALAVGIYQTGLANILSAKIEKVVGKKGIVFLLVITVISCFSQNLIPIHIAFIPILIPPLLHVMNDMKLDRRAAACALTFGLKAPYVVLPVGFGLLFHDIIRNNMIANGMDATGLNIFPYMILPGIGMIIGLFIALFISYRKPREYKDLPIKVDAGEDGFMVTDRFTKEHLGAGLGAITAFGMQLAFGSLPLGALCGLAVMIAFGAIPFLKQDATIDGGVKLMGFIAFVMLVASGYGGVIRATGGVEEIVVFATQAVGDNKILAIVVMLSIGLLVDMGIGTSFGTVPIVATVYVPICLALNFSLPSTAVLLAVSGALGDAGAPASDSTLGPTAGLNADGQHDHIWDTCVPTFLHYNPLLLIFGTIAIMIF